MPFSRLLSILTAFKTREQFEQQPVLAWPDPFTLENFALLLTGSATLTLITIVSHWNSFMWPLVVTTGTQWRVVTVATASLKSQFNGNWTLVMAATTLALVPLRVLFLIFQRSFVRSITIAGSA